jgi:hypothetical protein
MMQSKFLVFALCPTCCRTAFCRVMRGVFVDGKQQGQLETTTFRGVRANSPARRRIAERKGGVSVLVSGLDINHGHSRTRLTNVRLESVRSCFYSCSSCQFEIRSAA